MKYLLLLAITLLCVNAKIYISGELEINPLIATTYLFGPKNFSIVGNLQLADPPDACSSLLNKIENDTIILALKDNCLPEAKILNIQDSGALGGILIEFSTLFDNSKSKAFKNSIKLPVVGVVGKKEDTDKIIQYRKDHPDVRITVRVEPDENKWNNYYIWVPVTIILSLQAGVNFIFAMFKLLKFYRFGTTKLTPNHLCLWIHCVDNFIRFLYLLEPYPCGFGIHFNATWSGFSTITYAGSFLATILTAFHFFNTVQELQEKATNVKTEKSTIGFCCFGISDKWKYLCIGSSIFIFVLDIPSSILRALRRDITFFSLFTALVLMALEGFIIIVFSIAAFRLGRLIWKEAIFDIESMRERVIRMFKCVILSNIGKAIFIFGILLSFAVPINVVETSGAFSGFFRTSIIWIGIGISDFFEIFIFRTPDEYDNDTGTSATASS